MERKYPWYYFVLALLMAASVIYCAYLAGKIDSHIEDMTADQQEMMAFLEHWKECV